MGSNLRTGVGVMLPSNLTRGAVDPDTSSRPDYLHEPLLVSSTAGPNIRQSLHVDENRAQVSLQQETLPAPMTACDPQTPVSEASTQRSAQKSSNK
jgi:hypothetical protein